MPFDFFVSYARADNRNAWITRFVEGLQEEQRRFTGGREFRVFFDTSEIRSLDDWRHRIYESLAASHLLIAFISPSYFASEWCRREWHTWIDIEIAKHVLSDGAAPVYIVEVPWLGRAMSEQQVAEEITRLSTRRGSPAMAQDALAVSGQVAKRQLTQARPFYGAGLDALRREDLRQVLARLANDLSSRSEHVRAAANSCSTIPPYNRRFVGRLEELTLLRERLHQGRTSVISGHKGDLREDHSIITSVHGLGGIGKTELAFTYAHAFAGLYPGGRFLVPCDGRSDLRLAMLALEEIFPDQISDDQRKTIDLHFGAVRECLRRRLREMGRILLVLDNVTDAALLRPEQTDSVGLLGPNLHLLATTRLGAPEISDTFDEIHWLTLGELRLEDSLRLLEKHRPFATPEEHAAAESIARRLGGFALCVEVVGAYLGQHPEQGYEQFLATMGLEDLALVDLTAERRDVVTRRHNNEKRLRVILDHTLRDLFPEAMTTLHFAALLPPDHIALPWLLKLVGTEHSAIATDAPAWRQSIGHIMSLALLTRGEDGETQALDESHQPRIVRCHRLLQDYLRGKSITAEIAARQKTVDALVSERDAALERTLNWVDARWELEPFAALAGVWDEMKYPGAATLLSQAGLRWLHLAQWSQAEPLLRRALAIDEAHFGPRHPRTASNLNNLAQLLQATNRLEEAGQLLTRAIEIFEKNDPERQPHFATALNNLAQILRVTNRLTEAEPLLHRALALDEAKLDPENPELATKLNNLATLLGDTNRRAEAEPLLRRALRIDEMKFGPEHPKIAIDLNNLALLLHDMNRMSEAEPYMRRALAIDVASFGQEHPNVAIRLNNLAQLLLATERLAEAEPLLRRALAIDETCYSPEHPQVACALNNFAQLLLATNRHAEAEPLMRRALMITETSFGPDHLDLATCLNNLAGLLQATNRLPEAERHFRRVVEIIEKKHAERQPNFATALNNLAGVLRDLHQPAEAERLLRRALTTDETSFGPKDPRVALRLHNLAVLLQDFSRLAEAEPLLRRMVIICASFTADTRHEHPQLQMALGDYYGLLTRSGLTNEQARQYLRAAMHEGGLQLRD